MPKKVTNSLLAAVQHVSLSQAKRSTLPQETHCRIFNRKIVAMSGPLSAGVDVQDEIECCPHTDKFLEALKQCPTEHINLTLLDSSNLSIRSGMFQATVPCVDPFTIPAIFPDDRSIDTTPEFEQALQLAGSIVSERAKTILNSCVQLRDQSIISSNGEIILEAWHGTKGPSGLLVPKMFIAAVKKLRSKTIYRLAGADKSLTVYFADGSWFKSALPVDPAFPDLQRFLNQPCNPEPVPLGFFDAVNRLAPFSRDGRLYFTSEGLCTDNYKMDGAINFCSALPTGISFAISALQAIEPFAEKLAFSVDTRTTYFFGRITRGAISQRTL